MDVLFLENENLLRRNVYPTSLHGVIYFTRLQFISVALVAKIYINVTLVAFVAKIYEPELARHSHENIKSIIPIIHPRTGLHRHYHHLAKSLR